ncbi:TetR family transcriptional regulator [Nonomuraea sp. NPDC046570]|uniref:TetR family transcriptional regulator n=1 Tax=Nonomuraea sp. NPDC046570 TaxID=3155255 RepID=UPI0033CFA5CD
MTGLRERTRRAVRSQLAEVAMKLFIERGFDETTVDDIAGAAGISKRSFFRYFPAKEDVVFEGVQALGDDIAEEFRNRPATEGPWESLHAVLREWNQEIEDERRALERQRLIETTPVLRARFHHKRDEIRRQLADAVRTRSGLDAFAAELITACAAAALDCASDEWFRLGAKTDRAELIDRAFGLARPACCPPAEPSS